MQQNGKGLLSALALVAALLLMGDVRWAEAQAQDANPYAWICSAQRGEFAPESTVDAPVLRFAVSALQEGKGGHLFKPVEIRGSGYLYFSRDRIQYGSDPKGRQNLTMDVPRSDLNSAGEWTTHGMHMGMAELQFTSSGKWYFGQMRCGPSSGQANFQDILEAAENFDAALARVKAETESKKQEEAKAKREAEEKAALEAAARAPKTGTLQITTQPGEVQVYLDNKFKGVSSDKEGELIIEGVEAGSHRLRLNRPGYKELSQDVAITAAQAQALRFALEPTGPKPLGFDEVEEALKNGLPPKRMTALVRQYGVDFTMTTEQESRLRSAGADDSLILAVVQSKK